MFDNVCCCVVTECNRDIIASFDVNHVYALGFRFSVQRMCVQRRMQRKCNGVCNADVRALLRGRSAAGEERGVNKYERGRGNAS